MVLSRSGGPMKSNEVRFRCAQSLGKHEIQEYLGKLYRLPFKDNEMPHTSNKQGKIMLDRSTNKQWKRKDHKKVIVRLDYDVDPDYQKLS